jgi:DNA replication protein DnaC
MESLGDVLGRLRRQRIQDAGPDRDPEWVDRMLLDAARPPWSVARLEADLAALAGEDSRDARGARTRLEHDLELARWYEALAVGRSAGCWCLGMGGHHRTAHGLGSDGEPIYGWQVYCDCQDGALMKAKVQAAAEAMERDRVQAVIERMYGSLPGSYKDWSLISLAAQSDRHQRLAARIQLWIDEEDRWLYLYGPVGTGKTGAAVGALRELAERGQTSLFVEVSDMLRRLRSSYGNRQAMTDSLDVAWEALVGVQVLLVDDIGAERHRADANVDWATETLWDLIATRHRERRRTIFTSNLAMDELTEILGHPRTTSRISELAVVIDTSRLPNLRDPVS